LLAMANHDWPAYYAVGISMMATYDDDKARALFAGLSSNNTWQVPTVVWSQAAANLDDPNLANDFRLKYVPASVRKQWDPEKLLRQSTPEERLEMKQEAQRDLELVGAMHRAGVQFMAGSDGPDPYVFPGFSLHDELEWLVKSGLTPTQALQAATLSPALFLGKLDKYGVVEKGHVADLVLLDANPLEDIGNTRKIEAVVVGGKYYSRADLDQMLTQVEQLAKEKYVSWPSTSESSPAAPKGPRSAIAPSAWKAQSCSAAMTTRKFPCIPIPWPNT
jgi:hypothetical protein